LGGFFVDSDTLKNNMLYRETLRQYLSTLAGHGVPLLFIVMDPAKGRHGPSGDEFFSAITESLYRHNTETALVPVEVSFRKRPPGNKSGGVSFRGIMSNVIHVNFSNPLFLSEFAGRPEMAADLAEEVKKIWTADKKVLPHYIICKILSLHDYSIGLDSAAQLVKEFMSGAGRQFDYAPARIVKKGTDFLVKNGTVTVSGGRMTAEKRDEVDFYSSMIGQGGSEDLS
jgi:hypothetical protein